MAIYAPWARCRGVVCRGTRIAGRWENINRGMELALMVHITVTFRVRDTGFSYSARHLTGHPTSNRYHGSTAGRNSARMILVTGVAWMDMESDCWRSQGIRHDHHGDTAGKWAFYRCVRSYNEDRIGYETLVGCPFEEVKLYTVSG